MQTFLKDNGVLPIGERCPRVQIVRLEAAVGHIGDHQIGNHLVSLNLQRKTAAPTVRSVPHKL